MNASVCISNPVCVVLWLNVFGCEPHANIYLGGIWVQFAVCPVVCPLGHCTHALPEGACTSLLTCGDVRADGKNAALISARAIKGLHCEIHASLPGNGRRRS